MGVWGGVAGRRDGGRRSLFFLFLSFFPQKPKTFLPETSNL
jgi:hypothetical protein